MSSPIAVAWSPNGRTYASYDVDCTPSYCLFVKCSTEGKFGSHDRERHSLTFAGKKVFKRSIEASFSSDNLGLGQMADLAKTRTSPGMGRGYKSLFGRRHNSHCSLLTPTSWPHRQQYFVLWRIWDPHDALLSPFFCEVLSCLIRASPKQTITHIHYILFIGFRSTATQHPPMAPRPLLVLGATGKQGKSVINALLTAKSHDEFRILAVTRGSDSPSAQSSYWEVKSHPSYRRKPRRLSFNLQYCPQGHRGALIWGSTACSKAVQDGAIIEGKEKQCKDLIDAAIANGTSDFVYSSVDRHCEDVMFRVFRASTTSNNTWKRGRPGRCPTSSSDRSH